MFTGYSRATPALWAMAGYDAMVVADHFLGTDKHEFIWAPSASLAPNRSQMLVHSTVGHDCKYTRSLCGFRSLTVAAHRRGCGGPRLPI